MLRKLAVTADLSALSCRPWDYLNTGTPYDDLGLGSNHWTDAHPILINRPIVVTPWGVKLCRASEAVLDILPPPQKGPFAKERG